MAKAVRMQDIAEQVGVSVVTVSKALSGQRGMSEAMRRRIIETADAMGYVRGAVRRSHAHDERTFRIGILVADRYLDRYVSFYQNLQQLVAQELAAMDCATLLEGVGDEAQEKGTLPQIIMGGQVDGVILIGRLSDPILTAIHDSGIPHVYLDFSDHHYDEDAVVSDNYYGAYILTNYLFSLGHSRIGYVGTLLSTSSITDRYFGYRRALLEHACEAPDEWVIQDRDPVSGELDEERYMRLPEDMPTAFVCNSDLTAALFIRKLRAHGYSVPEDISVVGYDNFIYPGLCNIEITTFDVDTREMAYRAVHNLLHRLRGESYRRGVVIVGGRLIERDSAAAPSVAGR